MSEEKNSLSIVAEKIINKIVVLRGEKVILDFHLAELYGVESRVLKQAVRRNMARFPADDFMFELTEDELDGVVSHFVIPHKKYLGGAKPFAFTEAGVAMLSSVLNSQTAIDMNIAIMRTFVALRKVASNYEEVLNVIADMRSQYDAQFEELFTALEKLINPPQQSRPRVGFRRAGEQD
jgi:hypothetical protein